MPWIKGESIATRPRCGNCGEYVVCDFVADDDVWKRAVPRHLQTGCYLCLTCFARSGDERLVRWEEGLEIIPLSLRSHLEDVRGLKIGDLHELDHAEN